MTGPTIDVNAPHSVAHASFTIVRDFPVPVERVWQAFADPEQKKQWFGADEQFEPLERSFDFRVGGVEIDEARWHDGPTTRFVGTYTDIVEHERIVLTYDMWLDGKHISTSLLALEFEPLAGGTRFTHAEHGVHLDGFDDGSMREEGTRGIVDVLEKYLTS